MPRLNNKALLFALVFAHVLMGCGAAPGTESERASEGVPLEEKPALGLMTSLPLYWPLGAEVVTLASGNAEVPWQRKALEVHYDLIPLDTLSEIAAIDPQAPATDPLAQLDRLAVIQPRGLSPSDNVALDNWVRSGGELLLVLDPMLTGEYEIALGDPRRPTDTALIPPVIARWGLEIIFDDGQTAARTVDVPFADAGFPLALAGQVRLATGSDTQCTISAEGALAKCSIGEGHVTVLADATIFEYAGLENGEATGLTDLTGFAFSP